MPSNVRLQRIADRIREEISAMMIKEINDPRLHQVYVSDVRVDRELTYADIYVSALEGQARSKDILAGMESASGFFRKNLAARVELRAFPRLRFHWDPTPEHAEHMERLFAQIREERDASQKAK